LIELHAEQRCEAPSEVSKREIKPIQMSKGILIVRKGQKNSKKDNFITPMAIDIMHYIIY